jgi:hypothetical protein
VVPTAVPTTAVGSGQERVDLFGGEEADVETIDAFGRDG